VETDDRNLEVLVALLGLRSLGGEGIDPKHPLVTTLKKPIEAAKKLGHLEEAQVSIPTTSAKGKPTTKKVKLLSITPSGKDWITKHASAEQQAATNLGYLNALKAELERDRQKLQEEVKTALSSSAEGGGTFPKELESVTKKLIEAIGKQYEKLEQKIPVIDLTTVLSHIDQTYSRYWNQLQSQLEQDRNKLHEEIKTALAQNGSFTKELDSATKKLLEAVSKQMKTLEEKLPTNDSMTFLTPINEAFAAFQSRLTTFLSSIPTSTAIHAEPKKILESTIKQAYDKLCLFIEFKDGMVELPRLYHETRKTLPELTVSDFHKELMELWGRRELQLHVLNEVYKAAEPDKGIHHNNLLYYYLLWKRPS
jgi:outer membrane murein-binding lipoprotein Lpp